MKKLGLILAVAALLLTGFGAGASPSRAQALGADAIDAVYPLSLTEAINNRNPDVVLQHFVDGATVTFDNSAFSIPDETIPAAQYAARQRPNNPDVPADLRLEVVDGSLQISATLATWTWRQTAGFLRDLNIDYIEFNVVAETEDRRFKSLTLAPTKESIAKLPYSPSPPAGPIGMPVTGGPSGQMVLLTLVLLAVGLVLAGLRLTRARTSS
ncbi:MAG TPA: hypothetical protein VFG99_10520 [Chloroflexia bacterium]|nr:hypothetical protein [Chloroflexia bacterium]